MNIGILLVEDNQDAAKYLKDIIERDGYFVTNVETKDAAISVMSKYPEKVDIVILDLRIPAHKSGFDEAENGFLTLEYIKKHHPQIEVIILTASEDINDAVKAIKMGAYDFLTKTPNIDLLKDKIKKISEVIKLEKEYIELKQRDTFKNIIGQDSSIRNILKTITKIANSDISVFIDGESGTGKELIARAVHEESNRAGRPFISINCAAIPAELVESELFGHEKGVFTGADRQRIGRFEQANSGTLFLDEITEMRYELQAKMLRAIETKSIVRVGGNKEVPIDIRIISATNKDIKQLVNREEFREDLYQRLNFINIHLPPLRNRKTDIPLLAKYFLDNCSRLRGISKKELSKDALDRLINYNWPGNIRELKKTIEVSILLNAEKEIINTSDLTMENDIDKFTGKTVYSDLLFLPLKNAKEEFEKKYLENLLSISTNQSEAAKKAKIDRSNLNKLIKKYGLQ